MKKLSVIAACLVLVCAFAVVYAFKPSKNNREIGDTVRTESGEVSGTKNEAGDIQIFKGIPFAAPPVGELRWKAPQPLQSWSGVKQCTEFGPSPMQGKPVPFGVYTPEFLIPETPISEDCLYLNVWTGAKKSEKRPVFVWIYGGGFGSGGAGVPIYDGDAMAKKGIIFVSINYRVGVFGFMAHPDLTKESPNHASGNYGLLDQVAALQWVKKNIAAFGGDPDNVTIGGQSAGSMSVSCLVASPLAKGLFNKAIAESGSLLITKAAFQVNALADAEQQGVKLAQSVNATSLEDLRKVPAADLMKFPGKYGPITDGYLLPEPVPQIFEQGKQNNVAVITGWNADEGFAAIKPKDAFVAQVKEQYGTDADTFFKYFPASTDEAAANSQNKLSRDMIFAMSDYKWAKLQSQQGKAPVYLYNFNHKLPATADFVKYGAFHTGEVAYVMDNLKFLNRPWLPEDHHLATTMADYWANFIKYGNPNGKGLPDWPQFNTQTNQVQVLDIKTEKQALPAKDELEFMLAKTDK